MSSHHNSNKGSFNTNQQFVTPMGNNKNNPQKIHVAHRRSPSELTNLMIEQLNIGNENRSNESRSNEGRSNYHNSQNPSPFLPPPPLQGNANNNNNNNNNYYHYSGHSNSNSNAGSRGHSRNNSYGNAQNSNGGGGSDTHYHKRKSDSQSSIVLQPPQSSSSSSAQQGHSRRHSLGLNEAKKAAAEEQMKRQGQMSGHNTPPHSSTSSGLSSGVTTSSTLSQPPVVQAHGNGLNHSRNNSLNAFTSPNKSFQFPAKPPSFGNSNSNGNDNDENSGQDYHYAYSPRKFQQSHSRNNSGYNSGSTGGSGGGYANNNNNNNNNQHYSHKNQNSHSGQQSLLLEPLQTHHHHYNNSNSSNFHKHSMSNSNSNSNSNANPQSQRKSLFAPYLPQANIPQLLQEGKLVLGTLRVNKKNRSDAWVSTDGVLDADIFICGSKDRNRALENDLVAVELLCVDDVWGSKKEKEEKKRRKDQGSVQQDLLNSGEDYHNDATVLSPRKDSTKRSSFIDEPVIPSAGNSNLANFNNDNNNNAKTHENDFKNDSDQQQGLKRRGSLKQRPTQKKNDDVEVEGQSLLLVEEEEINDDFKPLYAGHIVAVLDRIPGQLFSGTLGLLRPSQSSSSNSSENNNNKDNNNNNNNNNEHVRKPKIVWFKPTDKKVPLVAIPTEQAPEDFVTNSENYANKLFIASIKRWPITSLHPFGTLVEQLGEINESATEVEAILKNNNFESNEYLDPQNRSREKPIFKPYPFQSDTTQRPVYQSPNIHTIKQSLNGPHDMALQVEHFAPGGSNAGAEIVRFSVHVVDVTEHIENGSSLDRRARKRSTGVYLPQKTVYLLPQKVNSELSLTKGSKATTLSVHYDIDLSNGKILGQKIEESFIVPDGESIGEEELETAPNAKTAAPTAHFIESIQKIASLFNQLRMNNSKNSITPRLSLLETLDDEKIKISDLNYYFNENGYIMKEIHFKVNNTVAEFNYSKLGDQAFLRRHAEPLSTKFQYFLHRISEFNQFDTVLNLGNPELCLKSISKIEDNHLRKCIEILFYKTLNRSKYYIAGKVDPDQFGHYLLNYPIYTHFTCPFKRYADHVVHKQLKAVLKNQVDSFNAGNDIDSLKITAEYCNFKKDCAFAAQEQSIHLLLCKTINDMCKNSNNMDQVLTLGLVIQVYESSFDVYLPEFGIEKRVHGDQLPVTKAEFDNINKVLELYWNPSIDSATFIPNDEKKPNSYRSSIKNNFKSSSHNIAKTELRKIPELSQELQKTFQDWHLEPPTLSLLSKLTTKSSSLPETSGSASSPLNVFKNYTTTRIEGDLEKSHVQEIRELDYVPILVRAEIGMALPCLSVRALNPFLE